MYGRRRPVVYIGVVVFFLNVILYWNGTYYQFYRNHIDLEPPQISGVIGFPYPSSIHWRDRFDEGRFITVLSPYYRNRFDRDNKPQCYREISNEENASRHPYTIVTALSENHFCTFYANLRIYQERLFSIPRREQPRLIVYIIKTMPAILEQAMQEMVEREEITEVRHFDYSKYPEFWRLRGGTRGQYAWKAGILEETMLDFPGVTIWLDSGDRIEPSFFETISQYIRCKGFFTVRTGQSMSRWVHPGFFDYIHDNATLYDSKPNCGGAAFGFDTYNPQVLEDIFIPYRHCAQIKDCIAPEGSSRSNHRQDQAVLTYYVHKHNYGCSVKPSSFGLVLHGETSACQVELANGTIVRIRDQRLKHGEGIDVFDAGQYVDQVLPLLPSLSTTNDSDEDKLELPFQHTTLEDALEPNKDNQEIDENVNVYDDEVVDDVLNEDNEKSDEEGRLYVEQEYDDEDNEDDNEDDNEENSEDDNEEYIKESPASDNAF